MRIKVQLQVHNMILQLEKELKEKKGEFRDPEQQPPRLRLYGWIDCLKFKATVLYSAVAMSRGRVHRHDHTLGEQEEFVDKHLGDLLEDLAA